MVAFPFVPSFRTIPPFNYKANWAFKGVSLVFSSSLGLTTSCCLGNECSQTQESGEIKTSFS